MRRLSRCDRPGRVRLARVLALALVGPLSLSPLSAQAGAPVGSGMLHPHLAPSGSEVDPEVDPESGEPNAGALDPSIAEAQAAYGAGGEAYALGNYERAIQEFERAYSLSREPALLFNLGQAYTRWYDITDNVDDLKKARRLYENYVLNIGDTNLDEAAQAQGSADAQRRIIEVDRRIGLHEQEEADRLAAQERDKDDVREQKPVHRKAWFWVAVIGGVAVIAGGVSAGVILGGRKRGFQPELGTIGRLPPAGGATGPGTVVLRF